MFKLKKKDTKASALTSKQERQLDLELSFADRNRNFTTKAGAEAFIGNLPEALTECVEIVESK